MTLILVRHGQSTWNHQNRFTGWVDVPLTNQGKDEAVRCGHILKDNGYAPDVAFTSLLRRSIDTAHLALGELDRLWVPTHRLWQLNERHYGALAGLDRAETIARYGSAQVRAWRRSYTERPPLCNSAEPFTSDPRYAQMPTGTVPLGESLQDVEARVMPVYETSIEPLVRQGLTVLVVAHGNTLRALVKNLESISDDDIAELEIKTGQPRAYEMNPQVTAQTALVLAG